MARPPEEPKSRSEPRGNAVSQSIDALLADEVKVPPPPGMKDQANVRDLEVFDRFSEEHFPACFEEYARLLDWDRPWQKVLDTSKAPFWKWFVGGELNAAYNCVDRHLERHGNKAALIFVSEDESQPAQAVSYRDLYRRVNEFACLLRDFAGIRRGDRITFHLPMTPELPVSMLAAARIGAVHCQVFGGFSGVACGTRIADSGSRVLVTMDGYYRNGHWISHLDSVRAAVETAESLGQPVEKVLIWQRTPGKPPGSYRLKEGRDFYLDEVLPRYHGKSVPPERMRSEDPLFLMYTSGTTGRPKGCQHSTGGYLAYVTATAKYILDIKPQDVYWCTADIGWITGHSYVVYGPLALGTTSVLYEGVPSYPDAERPWRISESLEVTIFHTSPTAIRQLRKTNPEGPARHKCRYRVLVSVGEPIEPEVWRWYHEKVGKGRAAVVDTWWQTETGGFLCSTLPAIHPMKPGSTGPALPGIYPVILDEEGQPVERGSGRAGNICIRNPWPGIFQTIWGDPQRFVDQYYKRYNRDPKSTDWRDWPYFTGDGALEDSDGYYRILGRIDDVIKVAGHRLGAKELESACLQVPGVAEAAAVPLADEVKGRVPDIYVALRPGVTPSTEMADRVKTTIIQRIGKIAAPQHVYIVEDMPKTRSGKIMRRVLAAISNGVEPGDVSTLVNPEVVDAIRTIAGRRGGEGPGLSGETIRREVRDPD